MSAKMQPMLLCLDLGQGSEALARYVAARAASCNQPVHVLHVCPKGASRSAIEEARARLDRLVTTLLSHVAVEAVAIRAGLPEETIAAYGEEYPIGPIVLGRRQRSMVERIHVGSTTSAVISLASCPVLVVPLRFSEDIS
ncbi:MAG: universal stress protein [Thermodesulfobacteriota bacterium]|nr:universal stress protein [Thermodesulfobacteriota bacterium]